MNRPLRITRRSFLGAATAGLAVPMTGGPRPADAVTPPLTFALVTDTHVNVAQPGRTADLGRVMAHIASRQPDFVLHCGDLTDYGVREEFDLYRANVPEQLWSRIHHVPGNHEKSWNADNMEDYRSEIGPLHRSFDIGGIHLVSLDPQLSLEWDMSFGEDLLSWLESDLKSVPAATPVLLYNHFPLGAGGQFVRDDDDFFRLIRPFPVRAIFGGHVHRFMSNQTNGLTQLIGNGVINGPYYYWAQRRLDGSGPYLEISEVTVPAGAEITHRVVATVPLAEPGPGGDFGPLSTTATVGGGRLSVGLRAAPDPAIRSGYAGLIAEGNGAPAWQPLTAGDGGWTGSISLAGVPAGVHRICFRAADAAGVTYDQSAVFHIPSPAVRQAWMIRLDGKITGDLAAHDGLVVAASTDGQVSALRPDEHGAHTRWLRRLPGGVFTGPVFTRNGRDVVVGSTDHHLYGLNSATGRILWATDLLAPVTSQIAVTPTELILVAAGDRLYCLDRAGRVRWRSALGGIAVGSAACDGARVFVGSGDGRAHALDIRDGSPLWQADLTDPVDDAYHRLIDGPYAARMRILPRGDVLATTASTAYALDPDTGAVRWRTDGTAARLLYTPPILTARGLVVFDGKAGRLLLLDPDTGAVRWSEQALTLSWGSAPVPTSDPDIYWMVGNPGRLIRIDLGARTIDHVFQVMTGYTSSTPVLIGRPAHRVLVTAAKDGGVRGLIGLEEK